MKYNCYDLFAEAASPQEDNAERIIARTRQRIEQESPNIHMRGIRRVLIAAAALAVLISGAFAATGIWNALTGIDTVQAGKSVMQLTENGVLTKEGYLEITPEITTNENAPKTIETWYVPALCSGWKIHPFYYFGDTEPNMEERATFAWDLPEGDYVLLRQIPLSSVLPGACIDTVSLGFSSDYTLSEMQLGDLNAQCVSVPPSEYPELVDVLDKQSFLLPPGSDSRGIYVSFNGVRYDMQEGSSLARMYYPGLHRLYWSDGDYLFILEVSYSMPEQTLAAIVESLQPVTEYQPYVRIEAMEPGLPYETIPVQTPLFPTAVPAGWELAEESGRMEDDVWTWIWNYGDMSSMELNQMTDLTALDWVRLDCLGSTEPYESCETALGEWTVTSFANGHEAVLLWKTETECFVLRSSGPDHLNVDALLRIAESLRPIA